MATVTPAIEVLIAESLSLLDGARVGLISNHTALDSKGASTTGVLDRAGIRLAALFAPEHGYRGLARAGQPIMPTAHEELGIPIYSLYGDSRVPTPRMLRRVDVFVYDIQDVGARTFTYPTTMTLAAKVAGDSGKPFVVLDRPNPIRGDRIEGGIGVPAFRAATNHPPIPQRYGLTPGELVHFLAATGDLRAEVTVIEMRGYRQDMWFEDTGLRWVRPSPSIVDVEAALLYAGLVFFEATNMSVGRGSEVPFKAVGAPWLDAAAVADELNEVGLPGVRFAPTHAAIERGYPFGASTIPMVRVATTDRDHTGPIAVGAHMLRAIYRRHLGDLQINAHALDSLSGSDVLRRAIEHDTIDSLLESWAGEAAEFARITAPHRLYPKS